MFDYTVELDGGMEVYITGDLDGSNSINALDVNKLKRILSGALDVEESVRIAADINGDGVLNSLDANILSRMVAGKI